MLGCHGIAANGQVLPMVGK